MKTPAEIYSFLRPSLIVLVCFSAAIAIRNYWSESELPDGIQGQDGDMLIAPSPVLSIKEVVEIQVKAIANAKSDSAVLQCMSLASPQNRMKTGPIDRFGKMIRSPPFSELSKARSIVIGSPTQKGKYAHVIVTMLTKDHLRFFTWILARQSINPYDRCWMTEGVIPSQTHLPRQYNGTSRPI